MDDSKIIELYFARDEAAIKETKIAYGKKLDNLSFSILRNIEDAVECVNDTYLKTWNAIPPQNRLIFMLLSLKYVGIYASENWITGMPRSENLK